MSSTRVMSMHSYSKVLVFSRQKRENNLLLATRYAMKPLQEHLTEYGRFHTHRINQRTHYIGIPCIIIGLLLMLSWLKVDITTDFSIPAPWLLVLPTLMYYGFLDYRIAVITAIIVLPITATIIHYASHGPTHTMLIVSILLFASGWALQYIGHFYEKKQPAFYTNLIHLLIGPLYFIDKLLQKIRRSVK